MSVNDNPTPNNQSISKINTPLKASAVLLTSVILSSCYTDSSNSYTMYDVFGDLISDQDTDDNGDTGETGGETGETGGDTGETGGETGDTGDTGGDTE